MLILVRAEQKIHPELFGFPNFVFGKIVLLFYGGNRRMILQIKKGGILWTSASHPDISKRTPL